jgi:membrane protease YdiL (CAAX protease family)
MTATAQLACWAALATVGAVLAPPVDEVVSVGPFTALAIGSFVGLGVVLLLARGRVHVSAWTSLPACRALSRSVVLSVRSASEEVVWRGLGLGLLAPAGLAVALLASSALFAAAHVQRLGRRAAAHLGLGLAFGGIYVFTGSLGAAIAAHATYNIVLGLALLAEPPDLSRTCPIQTIDRARAAP